MSDTSAAKKKDTPSGDEPFAPLAKVPDDAPDKEMHAKRLAAIEVPTRKQVGVPAYPGAVITFAIRGTTMELHGSRVTTLPVIQLLTSASVEDVVAFYTKSLDDWTHDQQVFIHELRPPHGGEEDSATAVSRPFVKIQPTRAEPLVPDAATRIEIAYAAPSAAKVKVDR